MVYGALQDFLTGEELADTDDERVRQQLARLLVKRLGYARDELEPRLVIATTFNTISVRSVLDLTVRVEGRRLFVLRYGPGSLVTREKPALAAARILDPAYRIPFAVVTNGRDAEFLETGHGKVLGSGMEAIPDRVQAGELVKQAVFEPYGDPLLREKSLRILNVFDLEICCRGDSCRLP